MVVIRPTFKPQWKHADKKQMTLIGKAKENR